MPPVNDIIVETFERESRIVIASLLASLCDIELAEDALQDAMIEAMTQWAKQGVPQNPGAWIMITARRKVIDRLRRRSTQTKYLPDLYALGELEQQSASDIDEDDIADERLKLMFTCCHPALAPDIQVALTLQVVAGIPTEAIAKAFLVPTATMAQRLVRAKRKIRTSGIPYEVPSATHINDRLTAVLKVIYFIFNAGYTVPIGDDLIAVDLCEEAIRLAYTLRHLLKADTTLGDNAEMLGLLSLMLLHHARRNARISHDGRLILLDQQERARWDHDAITEGIALLDQALDLRQRGPFQIQAAIAALHVEATDPLDTDWHQIALLYRGLMDFIPSSVIELNRAVAVAMAEGVGTGLALLDNTQVQERLSSYYLYHATRADFLRRLNRTQAAIDAYTQAVRLCDNQAEAIFLQQRLDELNA